MPSYYFYTGGHYGRNSNGSPNRKGRNGEAPQRIGDFFFLKKNLKKRFFLLACLINFTGFFFLTRALGKK
jgi:hypothetical protein